MIKLIKRSWAYITALLTGKFDERADPKVQIEQAIQEAKEQHRVLTERAASVIANQKKAEMDLDRSMQELEKLDGSTQQAVMMADEATHKGDEQRANDLTQTAEAFADRLIAKEQQVEQLKQLVLGSAQASDQAKAAVNQNAVRLQKRLSERQQLMSQLDQAKMQEQMNSALASVSETVGQDVPSLDEVRQKIEGRYAKAKGHSELQAGSVEGRMLEVEQAAMNVEAQARLSQIRTKLGIARGDQQEAPAVEEGETQPSAAPAPAPVQEGEVAGGSAG